MTHIVLLATASASTNIVYHALERRFGDVKVLLEPAVPPLNFLSRRIKRLGVAPVIGQVLFGLIVVPILKIRARRRVDEIKKQFDLDASSVEPRVQRIPSANSESARELLRRLRPRVVVINGTRILSDETLTSVACPFINLHAGITPMYRGVHGGYWALVDGRPDLVGSTVHLVDKGIDTGAVIEQVTFRPEQPDSYATYPYLHLATGLPALIRAVEAALENHLEPRPVPDLPSRLRAHPTLWGYVTMRVLRGVR